MATSYPYVSILTPTYNRRKFFPILIHCVLHQKYPKEYIEWIILDDGDDKIEDLVIDIKQIKVRYYKENKKLTIGAKRNKLNQLATGDILICFDDDDYHMPERILISVIEILKTSINIVGSSTMYCYFTDIKQIYQLGPYGIYHATNGTLAYKKEYANTHKHVENKAHGEEQSFLNNFNEKLNQLDPFKTILVLSHDSNTYDKNKLRELELKKDESKCKITKTNFKLKSFIKDKTIIDFYKSL